ncbi:hypothetical protein O6R05_02920 [Peptoniphilus equinus]|uniref:Repeat protein n=1 Tax=Peptoniphilus equinus TaxID=3016343 RepID=A0ABY7QWB6_9FIRM|nr:hypothetical protein [Peptoniphilus equinus]WBW50513.1 hypothetical protein O6R05_02920 [Peptoniphilus equinus]
MKQKKAHQSWLALLLVFAMVWTMLPLQAFAEVLPADWKEETENTLYWDLAQKSKLTIVAQAEGIKSPGLNYEGLYTAEDGREVIRLSYKRFQNVATAVWEILALKVDPALYDKVDWTRSGMPRGAYTTGVHDAYTGPLTQFADASPTDVGGSFVKILDIAANGNNTGGHSRMATPIDLVLKAGQSVKDLDQNPIIQMRLLDKKYQRIYVRAAADKTAYNSYTFITMVPVDGDYSQGLLRDPKSHDYQIYGSSIYSVYNPVGDDDGRGAYLEVFHKMQKPANGDNVKGEALGYRQAFDARLIDVLREVDGNPNVDGDGMVAEVFIAGSTDKPYNKNRVPILAQNVNRVGNIGVIQVAGQNWIDRPDSVIRTQKTTLDVEDSVLHGGTTELNSGVSTVVRYYVDPVKMENALEGEGITSFATYGAMIVNNTAGLTEFTGTADHEMIISQGTKVDIVFDGRLDNINGRNINDRNIILTIGDAQYGLEYREVDQGSINYTGPPTAGMLKPDSDYNKVWTWTVPMGITIKEGTPLTITSMVSGSQRPTKATITVNNGSGDTMELMKNAEDTYYPRVILFSEAYQAGSVVRTQNHPNVYEVFDTDQNINGHSYYDGAFVSLSRQADMSEALKAVTASALSQVDNDALIKDQGYAFTFSSAALGTPLVKDMPLYFTNEDFVRLQLASKSPVVEQVQSKVKFMTDDVNFVEKIVPLNVNYSFGEDGLSNPDYVANGFATKDGAPEQRKFVDHEGQMVLADHDGNALEGDALTARQYPEPLLRNGQKIVGYTTVKLEPQDGKSVVEQFNALKAQGDEAGYVRTADDWNTADATAMIFDEYSPVTSSKTVYAVWDDALKVTLHANLPDLDVVREISVSETNFTADGAVIDMPSVYYTADDPGELQNVKKDGYTFVGWSTSPSGKLNPTGELLSKVLGQSIVDSRMLTTAQLTKGNTVLLPNDYNLKLEGTYQEWLQKDNIDLYAVYAPFIDITLDKSYKNYDAASKTYSDAPIGDKELVMGLLYRTAVTEWTDPTISDAANYFTVTENTNPNDPEILKSYDPQNPQTLTWSLPGYDKLGQRLSYSAVEMAPGSEANYENFQSDWSLLGIRVFNNLQPDGELVTDPAAWADPAGTQKMAAKLQTVSVGSGDDIDAYTSATIRTTNTQGDGTFTGYSINMINVETEVPDPTAEPVYDGDNTFVLNYDNANVDTVKVVLPGETETELTLKKNVAGTDFYIDGVSSETVSVKLDGDKLNISLADPAVFHKDTVIKVTNYIVDTASNEVSFPVLERLNANPVVAMSQTFNTDQGDAVITAKIPGAVLNEPKVGSEFILGTMVGGEFVPVPGVTPYVMKPGDVPGTDMTFVIPKDVAANGEAYYIQTKEIEKIDVVSTASVILDTLAPTVSGALEDETFRRYVDLSVTLGELPEGGRIVIQVGDGEPQVFTTTETAAMFLNLVGRADPLAPVTITVEDAFGNGQTEEATYQATKQLELMVSPVSKGAQYVRIQGEAGAEVVVEVYTAGTKVASGTAMMNGSTTKVNLTKEGATGKYRLKKGDKVVINGQLTKDDGLYTTNPYVVYVK